MMGCKNDQTKIHKSDVSGSCFNHFNGLKCIFEYNLRQPLIIWKIEIASSFFVFKPTKNSSQ